MRRLVLLWIWFVAVCADAAVPTFESFSTNQFQTNSLQLFYRDPHTNDAGIIYPALVNTLTLVTNENVYGTFSLPAKVTLLALGTNYLDVTTNTTWLLNSPTNDATQVTISLSAGAYQGQLLFVTSQNGSNSFTLPDLSEQWDVPGAYVDIQGDWVGTTNRGIILQYTAPDWIEMARFDPGQTGGGTVFGSGTVPNFPYWITPTTLGTSSLVYSNNNNIRLDSTNTVDSAKFLIQGPSGVAYMDVDGTGQVAHFQGGSVTAWFANDNQRGIIAFDTVLAPSVNNTIDLGNPTGLRWKNFALDGHISWNGSTNSLFDTWGAGSPEGLVTARPGSIYRDTDAGEIYKKATGTGAAGWIALSSGAASALWGSAGGVLEPSPAIDVVRIESQLADNGTNVAFIVDTAVPWLSLGHKQFSVNNAGTNFFYLRDDTTNATLSLGSGIQVLSGTDNGRTASILAIESSDGFATTEGRVDITAFGVGSGVITAASTDNAYVNYYLAELASTPGALHLKLTDDTLGAVYTLLDPLVASSGSATAYRFDTSNLLQSGDLVGAFGNAGTNVLSINSDGGILSGKGISTVDTVYSFRSSHAVNLGEDQRNTLYIDATRNSASYTNYAELNFSAENTTGSSATSANLLIDSNKSGLGASFEVALNTTPISTNNTSFIKFRQDSVTHFQANQIGIQTAQPSTGDTTITPNPTNAVWRLGKVITGATVALTTTNYVEVYIDGVVKKLALAQ